jgi:hypothetical protein
MSMSMSMSMSMIEAKAIIVGLQIRRPADPFGQGGEELVNDNGTHIFANL